MDATIPLPDLVEVDRELVTKEGLKEFMKQAWHVLEPSDPLDWNWHLDAICDHTQALFDGKIQKLLITVPPGTTKSLSCAVFAPAWKWTKNPEFRMLFASYAGGLSMRDSVKCRRLIESPWYQDRWADKFQLTGDQNTKTKFENDKTGHRVAASVGGTVTGERGHLVGCDDLLNAKEAASKAVLEEVHNFFWEVIPSRVNDLRTGLFMLIMQRLSEKDPAGEIIKREEEMEKNGLGREWVHLNLPMEYVHTSYTTVLGFKDPRTVEGELLHPERFPRKKIDTFKLELGSYAYAGQYQQSPVPREGGIIKEAWFKNRFKCYMTFDELMKRKPNYVVQSYDCASKPEEHNDPTVGGTFAVFNDHIEVWDVWSRRLEFPDVQRRMKDGAHAWRPITVLIEDKDSGQQHIQQWNRDIAEGKTTRFAIIPINPGKLDKFTRMDSETPMIEAGQLWLPEDAPWVAPYVAELTTFSSKTTSGDDQVDMTSQLLKWVRERRTAGLMVAPSGDEQTSRHDV